MTRNRKGKKDIGELSAMLTEENKRYVIAVANALLFAQKSREKGLAYETVCRGSAYTAK